MSLQVLRRSDTDSEPARFGLTVTKKVGGAVERNRIKRRLRAALRTGGLAPQAGRDYVVVARRDALAVSFSGLCGELTRLLHQARAGKAPRRPSVDAVRLPDRPDSLA